MAISPKRFIALGITVSFIASAFSNQVNAMELIDSIKMDPNLSSQLNLFKEAVNRNIELSSDDLLKILKLNDVQIREFNQKYKNLIPSKKRILDIVTEWYYLEKGLQYTVLNEVQSEVEADEVEKNIEQLIKQCVTANSEYEDIRNFAKAIIEIKRGNPAEDSKKINISNESLNEKVSKNSFGDKHNNPDQNYNKCKCLSALIGFALGAALAVIRVFFFEEDNVSNRNEHSVSDELDHTLLGPEVTGEVDSKTMADPEFKIDNLKLAASVFGVLGTSIMLSLLGIKLIDSTDIVNKIRQWQANDLEKRIKNVKLLRGQKLKIRRQMFSQKSKLKGKQN